MPAACFKHCKAVEKPFSFAFLHENATLSQGKFRHLQKFRRICAWVFQGEKTKEQVAKIE